MNEKLCVQIWWVMNIWAVPLPFRICEHTCSQHVHEAVIDNTAVIDSITISSTSSIIYAKIIGWLGYNKRHAYSVSMISISKNILNISQNEQQHHFDVGLNVYYISIPWYIRTSFLCNVVLQRNVRKKWCSDCTTVPSCNKRHNYQKSWFGFLWNWC